MAGTKGTAINVFLFPASSIYAEGVTVFLHRHPAHHALDRHPAVSHFFRLWLDPGMGRRAPQTSCET